MACAVGSFSRGRSLPPPLQPPHVVQFAKRSDRLIYLLGATADALADGDDVDRRGRNRDGIEADDSVSRRV